MVLSQSGIAVLHLAALVLGAALGLLFDLIRFPRILLERNRDHGKEPTSAPLRKRRAVGVAVFLEDFLFCQLAAVCLILLFYERNNGKIRPFAFFLALIGFVGYRVTLGKPVAWLLNAVSRLVHRAVRWVLMQIFRPIRKAVLFLRGIGQKYFTRLLARAEQKRRKRFSKKMVTNAALDACGLLPGGYLLKAEQTEEQTIEKKIYGRKEKPRKNAHGRKEKNAKNHRAEQESVA